MFNKLLVCLDGSELAEQVLPYVEELATRLGTHIILLHVYHPDHSAHMGTTPIFYSGEENAKNYLESKAKPLRVKGIEVECAIIGIQYPADVREEIGGFGPLPGEDARAIGNAISDYANRHNADSIAIATHGRSGLRRAVLGSIADFVLRKSGLPVLLIRPQKSKTRKTREFDAGTVEFV